MLQMPNIVKNPRIWLPAILTSAITGPIATFVCLVGMNGAPSTPAWVICGSAVSWACGSAGWLPCEKALANGAAAIVLTAFDWAGLLLISFVLPAVLCWLFGLFFRRIGWIREAT